MNKRELAKAVAVQSDVDLHTVSGVIDSFTDVVTAVVAQGQPVSLPGFAKFVKVDRPTRMGRNPATGETIRIKASKKARITPAKAFKDAVMSSSSAPKLVKGAWPIVDGAVKAAGTSQGSKGALRARGNGRVKGAAPRSSAGRGRSKPRAKVARVSTRTR
jgi:DNA-binding protein HU-beta